jgi:hypothetical protein
MVSLHLHGADVQSVFGLLGTKENDLTAAFGFVLSRCPPLAAVIAERVAGAVDAPVSGDLSFALEVRDDAGRTDLEFRLGSGLYIFEAKRGWLLPTKAQLAKYAGRVKASNGSGALVTLSQASHALASYNLPPHVEGVPVIHLPWSDVLADIELTRPKCRGHERLWLDEFRAFLREVIWMRPVGDSWTYCVVLNDVKPCGGASFKQIVTEQLSYFHPYGIRGWPTEPPNFMAFRWNGAVQRIHRIVEHEVVPQLSDCWPYLDDEAANRPHAVYRLGPRLPPYQPVPNGASYRASRLWVLLDQLQSAPTLAAALAQSKELSKRS